MKNIPSLEEFLNENLNEANEKSLANIIVDFLEENNMLDSNYTSSAHNGKNKSYMVEKLTDLIKNSKLLK